VFFDLGASFGFYSFYVAPLCGPGGAIHAFEANPVLIPHLKRSVDLNRSFTTIHLNSVAVGNASERLLPLYGLDRIGCSSLYPHNWLDQQPHTHVPVITIDDYVRREGIDRIDVMKVDIEGAELDAFQGMARTFRLCPPRVIICELLLTPPATSNVNDGSETGHRAHSSAEPRAIAALLAANGYELCRITDDGYLQNASLPVWGETTQPEKPVENVAFALPELHALRPDLFVRSGLQASTSPEGR
jgi:FkbM family methyltransferase